jgi:iron-sulfur cluster assembly protein
MITITDKAYAKLVELRKSERDVLWVSVIGGGCSGMSYRLDFRDYKFPGGDATQFILGNFLNPLIVMIDKKSQLFLVGVSLDFSDGLDGRGFEFHNPNSKRTCGCGTSFNV